MYTQTSALYPSMEPTSISNILHFSDTGNSNFPNSEKKSYVKQKMHVELTVFEFCTSYSFCKKWIPKYLKDVTSFSLVLLM